MAIEKQYIFAGKMAISPPFLQSLGLGQENDGLFAEICWVSEVFKVKQLIKTWRSLLVLLLFYFKNDGNKAGLTAAFGHQILEAWSWKAKGAMKEELPILNVRN